MLKKILVGLSALVVAVLIGTGSAYFMMANAQKSGGIHSGPWATSTSFGSPDASMYVRARVALFGLLALDKKETIYFIANQDSEGEALRGSCTYKLVGTPLAARWWSITAYAPDSYLIPNEGKIYSIAQTTVKREEDGSFVAYVSPERHDGNWLPVRAGEAFDLTARFYNPEASIYDDPSKAVLPTITKESCK